MELPQSVIVPGDSTVVFYYPRNDDEKMYMVAYVYMTSFYLVRLVPDEKYPEGKLIFDVVSPPGFDNVIEKCLPLSDRILIFGQENVMTYFIDSKTYDDTLVRYSSPPLRISKVRMTRDFFRLEYSDTSATKLQRKDSLIVDTSVDYDNDNDLFNPRNNLIILERDVFEIEDDGSFALRDLEGVIFYERRGDREVFCSYSQRRFILQSENYTLKIDANHEMWGKFVETFDEDFDLYSVNLDVDTFYFVIGQKVIVFPLDTNEIVLTDLRIAVDCFELNSRNVFAIVRDYSHQRFKGRRVVIVLPSSKIEKLRIYGVESSKFLPIKRSIITNREYREGRLAVVFESNSYTTEELVLESPDVFIFAYDPLQRERIFSSRGFAIFNDFRDLDNLIRASHGRYVVFDASTERYH
jgi:hypothetical protein